MASGTILWFDLARGYGFVRPRHGPRDAFLHASAVEGNSAALLLPGAEVEFELVQTGDGRLVARHVVPCRADGRRRSDTRPEARPDRGRPVPGRPPAH